MHWPDRFSPRTTFMRRSAIRELLKVAASPGIISFAGGLPAPEMFPTASICSATERVLQDIPSTALQYGETEGMPGLRDWLADHLSTPSHRWSRENVLITTGAQQALDLLARVFADPTAPVLVENPTYLAFLSAWAPHGTRFHPVACDAEGLEIEALPSRDSCKRAILYTIPDFQNPTGATLNRSRRHSLVEYARANEIILLEDTAYRDLRFDGETLPSLAELDHAAGEKRGNPESGCVLQVGTFSKILAPGLRVGWVAGPSGVIEKLTLAKQAADLHTSTLNQAIVLEVLRQGLLETHLPRLKATYRERRNVMMAALKTHMSPGVRWTRPEGGLFLFLQLPDGCDAHKILPKALQEKVAFVPGGEFHCDGSGAATLRLNFSHAAPAVIEEGVRRLARAMK